MQPDVHDRVLGLMSHLPHVLVYALVNALERGLYAVSILKHIAPAASRILLASRRAGRSFGAIFV